MIGEKANRLTIVAHAETNRHGQAMVECLCDCGVKIITSKQDWKTGHTKSCGCLKREMSSARAKAVLRKHGLSFHPLFPTWNNMMKRCYDPKCHAYGNYGARGISVCDRWHDPHNFIEDMGIKPSKKHTLERRNNDGNYCPDNCYWATRNQQSRNTRVSRFIEYNGQRKLLRDWAELYKINEGTLRTRIDELSWPLEKAFTYPARKKRSL